MGFGLGLGTAPRVAPSSKSRSLSSVRSVLRMAELDLKTSSTQSRVGLGWVRITLSSGWS